MRKIQLMGGPKIEMLHQTGLFNSRNPEDFGYSQDDIKDIQQFPQAPINVPLIEPVKPDLDHVSWLSSELKKEDYAEAVEIKSDDYMYNPDTTGAPDNPVNNLITSIPLSFDDVKALNDVCPSSFSAELRLLWTSSGLGNLRSDSYQICRRRAPKCYLITANHLTPVAMPQLNKLLYIIYQPFHRKYTKFSTIFPINFKNICQIYN